MTLRTRRGLVVGVPLLLAVSPLPSAADWSARLAEKAAPVASASKKTAAVKAAAPVSAPARPSDAQALYLVRATLLALDSANHTGNYTVVRDLAAPQFRERNSAADLAVIFTALRQNGVDLGLAAVASPEWRSPPAVDRDGLLRINGSMLAHPRPIAFDLAFRQVGGHWRLAELSVGLVPAAAPQAGH